MKGDEVTTGRDIAFMHSRLASAGIVLAPRVAASPSSPLPAAMVLDRDKVRSILVERGAPKEDLDWLVASCVTLADAYDYCPPLRQAYCARCREVVPCNALGCIYCQAAEATP